MSNSNNKQGKQPMDNYQNSNEFSSKPSLMELLSNNRDGILRVVAGVLALLIFILLDIQCVFQKYLNMDCLGCGMTRAWKSVFQGDFRLAFQYHRAYFTVPIIFIYVFKGKLLFEKHLWDIIVIAFIIIMFIVNYILT